MILNQQNEVRVARRPLESFLRRVKRELGLGQSDVTVCLVSNKAMAQLNQDFRKKKGPTDVLSFPATARRRPVRLRSKPNARYFAKSEYLGDIAISPATARRYAKDSGRHLGSELPAAIFRIAPRRRRRNGDVPQVFGFRKIPRIRFAPQSYRSSPRGSGKRKHVRWPFFLSEVLVQLRHRLVAYQANCHVRLAHAELPLHSAQERFQGPPRHSHFILLVQDHPC